jgi:hypothetical protein
VAGLGAGAGRPPEPVADLPEDSRGGNREAPVIMQEADHPARGLQAVDEPGQADPVRALDIQHGLTIEQFGGRDGTRHDDRPEQPPLRSQGAPT